MPIEINPLQVPALAALAGNQMGNLNLPLYGVDPSGYGTGLFAGALGNAQVQSQYNTAAQRMQQAQLEQAAMDARQNSLFGQEDKQALFREQSAMDRTQLKADVDLQGQRLQAQNYQQQALRDQQRFGLDQQRFGLDQQRLGLDTQKAQAEQQYQQGMLSAKEQELLQNKLTEDIKLKLKMEDKQLIRRGSTVAAYDKFVASITDPEQKKSAALKWMAIAQKDGIMTPEEASDLQADINKGDFQSAEMKIYRDAQTTALAQKGRQMMTANNKATGALDTALAKTDATIAKEASDTRASMVTLHTNAQQVLQMLPNIPDYTLGPFSKALGIDKLHPETQKVIGSLNAMALQLKEYYKLGSGQGFTDKDRDFLTEIAGNTGYYKYPLQTIVQRMDDIAASARYNSWKREADIRQNSSSYKQWLEANPEPAQKWSQPINNVSPSLSQPYTHQGNPVNLQSLQKANPNVPIEVLQRYLEKNK